MNWFQNFMMGRHGLDQLGFALMITWFVLAMVGNFTTYILVILALIPLAFCVFRMFSRNQYRRAKENDAFLKVWRPIPAWFRRVKNRLKGRKTHRYYKCPNCKNTLRVPKGKGKICITCPVCRTEFIKKT